MPIRTPVISKRALLGGAAAALLAANTPARADAYPGKSIRIIVPQGAGGMADVLARLLANSITQDTKHTAIVENRAGGGTMIGSEYVARAAPDGYTLLLGTVSLTIMPAIDSSLAFDPTADLTPISQIAGVPLVLLAHKSVPATNMKELVAYAKANPGKLSYASQGIGTSGHMTGELFKQIAGIDVTHVPYRGGAPAAQDLIAGHVQLFFDALALAIANVKNDSVRALAIAMPERAAALPDVPTTTESGFPGLQPLAWFGLFAPKGAPEEAVSWLSRQVTKTFSAPDVRGKLAAQGTILPLSEPAAFKTFMAEDTKRWSEVARIGKIKLK